MSNTLNGFLAGFQERIKVLRIRKERRKTLTTHYKGLSDDRIDLERFIAFS
jgi:hypothetical protein